MRRKRKLIYVVKDDDMETLIEANNPGHAMAQYRRMTGRRNLGWDKDQNHWRGYEVKLHGS